MKMHIALHTRDDLDRLFVTRHNQSKLAQGTAEMGFNN